MTNNISEKLKHKPSLGFMLLLYVFFTLFVYGICLSGVASDFSIVVCISAVGNLAFLVTILIVLNLSIRKLQLRPTTRTIILMVPLLLFFAIGLFLSITKNIPINKHNPAMSPTQKMKTKISTQSGFYNFEITDDSDKLVHNELSNIPDSSETYWLWDNNKRFWIYQHGTYYFLEPDNDKWILKIWGTDTSIEKKIPGISPPADLRP